MLKKRELRDATQKLKKACNQLSLITKKCAIMKTRLDRAERDRTNCFRSNLSRQMAVMQSVQQMFYEYVYMKSEEVTAMRFEIKHWVDDKKFTAAYDINAKE